MFNSFIFTVTLSAVRGLNDPLFVQMKLLNCIHFIISYSLLHGFIRKVLKLCQILRLIMITVIREGLHVTNPICRNRI